MDDFAVDLFPKNEDKLLATLDKVFASLEKIRIQAEGTFTVLDKVFGIEEEPKAKAFGPGSPDLANPSPVSGPAKNPGQNPTGKEAISSVLGSLATAVTGPMKAVQALQGVMTGLQSAFLQLTGKVTGFVAAASPAAAIRLEQVFEDLQATIGSKLVPIVEVAAEIVGKYADAIGAVDISGPINAVVEVMGKLSEIFLRYETIVLDFGGRVLNALVPVLEKISDLFDELTPAIDDVFNAFENILDAIIPALEELVNVALELFKTQMQVMIPIIIQTANAIKTLSEWFVKAAAVIDAVLKNPAEITNIAEIWDRAGIELEKRQRDRGNRDNANKRTTAAKGVSVLGIESVSSRALEAAGKIGTTNYLQQIADNTKPIEKIANKPGDDPQGTYRGFDRNKGYRDTRYDSAGGDF